MNKIQFVLLAICLVNLSSCQNISTFTKVKNFGMGFAIGLGALNEMPDAVSCVTDVSSSISDIEALIGEIKTNPTAILDIIKKVENIVAEFTKDKSECQALSAEGKLFFANLAQHFTNSTLREQGLINLIENFETVKQNIEDGVNIFKNGTQETDFIVSGSKIGTVVSIYANGNQNKLQSFLQLSSNSTLVSKVEHLALGFVFGSQALAQLPDALGCVSDVFTLKSEITQLIGDLKNRSIIDAIKIITEFVKQIQPDLTTCIQVKNELVAFGEDLEQVFTNRTRTLQGLENLFQNYQEVIQAVESTISSFKSGEDADFQNAGFQLGDIFRIFAYGSQNKDAVSFLQLQSNSTLVSKLEHLALGFVFGSQALAQLPDAIGCVSDVLALKSEISQIVGDLKNKSIIDAIKAVVELVKQVQPDVATCVQLKNELVLFGEDLQQVFTNTSRQVLGLQNLVKNFEEVVKAVESTVSSIRAGEDADLQNAGFQLGDIFRIFQQGNLEETAAVKVQVQQQQAPVVQQADASKKFLN